MLLRFWLPLVLLSCHAEPELEITLADDAKAIKATPQKRAVAKDAKGEKTSRMLQDAQLAFVYDDHVKALRLARKVVANSTVDGERQQAQQLIDRLAAKGISVKRSASPAERRSAQTRNPNRHLGDAELAFEYGANARALRLAKTAIPKTKASERQQALRIATMAAANLRKCKTARGLLSSIQSPQKNRIAAYVEGRCRHP